MDAEQSDLLTELPKPEVIGHLLSNEGILLTFSTADGPRFAAVAVTGEGESKPVAERTLAAAGDLAVHVDRLGRDIGKRGGQLYIVDIKNPQRARERTRSAMTATTSAALFACRTRQAFAAVCEELGVTREDIAKAAQLYPMFAQAQTEESKIVVGQAHKLATALKTREIYRYIGYSAEDKFQIGQVHPVLADQIARAVRFDVGDANKLPHPSSNDALLMGHLPYPVCYFEFDADGAERDDGTPVGQIRMMVLARDLGGEVSSVFFRSHPPGDRYFSMGFGARWRVEDGEVLWEPDLLTDQMPTDLEDEEHLKRVTAIFLAPVLSYLALLNRPGAEVTRVVPPAKLAASRQKSGKPPLFDFHRVKFMGNERTSSTRDGAESDRAGPRLHMRKGHVRRLALGKEIWIRSTIVGRASAGALGKDFLS
ncbi:hypothetical protein [Microvirga sp. VF16]|uniref:hypothetical protein n=1 Tax=Microvirga sp. VF16 TaxID=2807101 RepID=UPI00193E79AB|nr:hypothetical protein [Microvirga sp. VF16]QRM35130.1 hypothetical protein JO965_39730 [Microvirga sp. VF16]